MSTIYRSIQLDASPEEVWPIVADLGAIVNFHPFVTNSYYHSKTLNGVGAARVCEFGEQMAVLETAVDWNDGQSYTLAIDFTKGMAPPMTDVLGTVTVKPDGRSGSTASIAISYKPKFGPIGAVMNKLMIQPKYGKMLDGMMQGLKHHMETGETVDAAVLKRMNVPAAV